MDGMTGRLRVVLADDSVLLRSGLVRLLEDEDIEVVAEVGDTRGLSAALAEHRPDLAIVDVRMPPTFTDEGLHAALEIRRSHPDIGVLVLSQWIEEEAAADLLAGGTERIGYLLKDRVTDIDAFVDAIRRIAGGGSALDPDVVGQILNRDRRRGVLERLSPREAEVLTRMAEGLSNTAIARELVVTERAVEKHIRSIMVKLDLPPDEEDHNRRVMAVLQYLDAGGE